MEYGQQMQQAKDNAMMAFYQNPGYQLERREKKSVILDVSYDKVKKIQSVKPTIHKYLSGYVRSRFRRIDADEFVIATLLPVQRFKKATASQVYSDSRRMI